MRYKAKVSYDGNSYYGFQRLNELPTIQKELEKAVSIINKKDTVVKGASRTDKGVHAYGQVVHFDLDYNVEEGVKGFIFKKINDESETNIVIPNVYRNFPVTKKSISSKNIIFPS